MVNVLYLKSLSCILDSLNRSTELSSELNKGSKRLLLPKITIHFLTSKFAHKKSQKFATNQQFNK